MRVDYLIYEKATGTIVQFGSTQKAFLTEMELPEGCGILEKSCTHGQRINLETLEPEAIDYGEEPATWDQIRQIRDQLETAPINVNGHVFDADERSQRRMESALEHWESLPTLDSEGRLGWKLADNSYVYLNRYELNNVFRDIRSETAQRAVKLHLRAEELFREQRTLGEVECKSAWCS